MEKNVLKANALQMIPILAPTPHPSQAHHRPPPSHHRSSLRQRQAQRPSQAHHQAAAPAARIAPMEKNVLKANALQMIPILALTPHPSQAHHRPPPSHHRSSPRQRQAPRPRQALHQAVAPAARIAPMEKNVLKVNALQMIPILALTPHPSQAHHRPPPRRHQTPPPYHQRSLPSHHRSALNPAISAECFYRKFVGAAHHFPATETNVASRQVPFHLTLIAPWMLMTTCAVKISYVKRAPERTLETNAVSRMARLVPTVMEL